ncbi:hypothetical protein [uncultured Helicobacter sp.]
MGNIQSSLDSEDFESVPACYIFSYDFCSAKPQNLELRFCLGLGRF